MLAWVAFFYKQNSEKFQKQEVEDHFDLFKQFREGAFEKQDTIILHGNESSLPVELVQEVEKIDQIDVYKYYEGIDTESLSYKFNNILQMFRIQFAVEIKV